MPASFPPPPPTGPLRLSDIKLAIYHGLKFNRVMYAGWSFYPAPAIVAKDINKLGLVMRTGFVVPLEIAIREVMMDSIRENFRQGGRPDSWAPLADYTVSVRHATGPILVRSGNLMDVASSFGVWSINNGTAAIKQLPSMVWYGNLHQGGYGSVRGIARRLLGAGATKAAMEEMMGRLIAGARPVGKQSKFVIPERPFAMFQEQDIDAIQEIFANWMEEMADNVGRSWHGGSGRR
jgi:phage gpG-like protein